jgi:hypothetical protein
MELIVLIVILTRLIIPFSIFRWPLWGALASIVADGLDYIIFDLTTGQLPTYQQIDKLLDIYYLSIEFLVSLQWMKLAKFTSISLFAYRLIGVVLFEVTNMHVFLFIFPNVFEYFFIFELARQRFFKNFELTP